METEEELAIRKLRRSEEHFRTIIENVSDLISTIDPNGLVSYVSPSVTRALSYPAEELIGMPFASMVHPEELPLALSIFMNQLSNPDAVGALDARIADSNLKWRWYSIVASNYVVDGKVVNVIVNARDITERRLLLYQLEQANRVNSLGRLAATVAHEFNNVLMGMQPFAELIQRPNVSQEIASKGAKYIASSISRGKRVALDILRFTQPANPTLTRVQLDEWWQQLLPELRAGTQNDITMAWDIPSHLAVTADAAQLSQVFSNLISNARHALPRGGHISVVARRPEPGETFSFGFIPRAESYVQISVSDDGCGIPADIICHVFDPLFTTKSNGGTGLGLAVVHQIMTNHGGAVLVESTPGLGTTFHTFIRAADELVGDTRVEVQPALQLDRTARALIIDDEIAVAEGLAAVLNEEGIATVIAMTAAEGEAQAEHVQPDFVLIDVGLPDANGAEVAKRLRESFPKLRVVVISGHANVSAILPLDANLRFLQKPFDTAALLRILRMFQTEKHDDHAPTVRSGC